jgi:hypothetical protein
LGYTGVVRDQGIEPCERTVCDTAAFTSSLAPRGLGGGIRTPDLRLPKPALYQVEPHPDGRDGGSRTLADSLMRAAFHLETSRRQG